MRDNFQNELFLKSVMEWMVLLFRTVERIRPFLELRLPRVTEVLLLLSDLVMLHVILQLEMLVEVDGLPTRSFLDMLRRAARTGTLLWELHIVVLTLCHHLTVLTVVLHEVLKVLGHTCCTREFMGYFSKCMG